MAQNPENEQSNEQNEQPAEQSYSDILRAASEAAGLTEEDAEEETTEEDAEEETTEEDGSAPEPEEEAPAPAPESAEEEAPAAAEPEENVPPVPKKAPAKTKKKKSKGKKKKKKKRRKHRSARFFGVLIMLVLIFVISITLAVGILDVGRDMLGIDGTETLVVFNIPEGATTTDIAEDLAEQGIIRIPKAFIYFSRLSGKDASYIAGDHQVSSSMAYEAIISELSGTAITEDQVVVDVMFPEGCTLLEAAAKLKEANVCDDQRFLYYFNAGNLGYKFEEYLPTGSSLKFMRMEGYLFPDTYNFYEEMDPLDVCQRLYVNFDSKITDEMYAQMEKMDITLDEVITMASIVQAEAANDSEMAKIASVFWNRLENPSEFAGMLQSDPTSKYVREVIRPNINLPNEQMYDAYDTYICKGLPAGAIGNPGLSAIKAVLWPARTDYYYFYANIDTKTTYFATTLEEHEANIEMVKEQQAAAAAAAEEEE